MRVSRRSQSTALFRLWLSGLAAPVPRVVNGLAARLSAPAEMSVGKPGEGEKRFRGEREKDPGVKAKSSSNANANRNSCGKANGFRTLPGMVFALARNVFHGCVVLQK